MRAARVAACLGALVLVEPALLDAGRAVAQRGVEVGPLLGFYAPLSAFEGPFGPVLPGSNNYKHSVAIAVGADLNVWITDRIGVAAQIGASPSDVRQAGVSAGESLPASVWWLGGAATLRVTPRDLANDVRLRAGIGYVRHGGAAFEPFAYAGSVTGLLGIAATLPVRSQLRAFAGLDAHLYRSQLTDSSGVTYEPRFQTDVIARVGVLWSPTGGGDRDGDGGR